MVEVATTRGLAALSARVADALTGSEPKLMLLPHPKCSCCWAAPTCSKKGTFGSSGSSVSLPICWTEEFRNLYDSFPLQKFSEINIMWHAGSHRCVTLLPLATGMAHGPLSWTSLKLQIPLHSSLAMGIIWGLCSINRGMGANAFYKKL